MWIVLGSKSMKQMSYNHTALVLMKMRRYLSIRQGINNTNTIPDSVCHPNSAKLP